MTLAFQFGQMMMFNGVGSGETYEELVCEGKSSQVWEMVLMDGVCTSHAEGVVAKSHDPGVVFGDGRARS